MAPPSERRMADSRPTVATLQAITEAFNAHDLDAIMEVFADDCVLDTPRGPDPWGRRFTGKAAVREGLAARFEGLPDVHYGDERHWVSGNLGVSEWLLTGTTRDGVRLAVRGCDHWEFRDGRVIRKDSYWKIVDAVALTPSHPAMNRLWTILGVGDVPRSFAWYQALLGQPSSAPAHQHFGQIVDANGTVLLCLHAWGAHEHPTLTSPGLASPGNGLLLFFRVDNFDAAFERARALVARFEEEPHLNPNTQTREFSLRDPDGYYVTISALA